MSTAKAELNPSTLRGSYRQPGATPALRRRERKVRSRSIRVARATKGEIERARLRLQEEGLGEFRPRHRSECIDGPRPCPHVSCKHHLYLDVSPQTGTIKLNFPDLEVWEMTVSCALDIADAGGVRLEDVGVLMNITRERARQIESKALAKLETLRDITVLRDLVE
ncbi:MAG TPA: sigma factor-like helix-turn-helix DNA-binding protein [Polyangiaceae bacterium]